MNAELRRNLWLELSKHRLIGAPVVLVLVLLMVSANDSRPWPGVFTAASAILVLLLHFWGTRKAAEAVTDEVRERTWDWQRLSSLGPWGMAWGKLAGTTAFPWYVALLCVAAMAVAAVADSSVRSAHWIIAGLAASAIALHGVALAGSIQAGRKDSKLGSRIGTLLLIPIALVTAAVYLRVDASQQPTVSWFGWRMEGLRFLALTAVLFASWAVLAAYREMQRELKVRTLPWAYPAFVLFVGVYVAGFDAMRRFGIDTAFVFASFFAAVALTYYGLFADVTTAMGLRRIALRVRAGQWRRAAEELPLWTTTLPLAAVFALAASLQPWPEEWAVAKRSLGPFPLAIFLLALRDTGLLVFFALGRKAKRVEAATLLYIVLLSSVLPTLFAAMGLDVASQALAPWRQGGGIAAIVMAVHVAIVGLAVGVRWHRMSRLLDGESGTPRGV